MRPYETGFTPPPDTAPRTNIPPVVMQNGVPTMGGYEHGDARYYGIPGREAALARQQAARRYALQRLAQMRRVMSVLPPQLQQQFAAAGANADPAAAWRAFSGAFAAQSRAAGYADPRYYLARVLPEIMRAQAVQRTGGV